MADHTAAAGHICVAPLSSPYSLLPRAHTYALVAVLALALPRGWLYRAALAAFTTRTAIFAVDAAVVLHDASSSATAATKPVPLDAVVLLETLGLAVLVACWLLAASARARESAAQPLVRIWAVVVTISAILAFVAVARLGKQVAAGVRAADITEEDCEGIWMDKLDVFGAVEHVSSLGLMGWRFARLERRVGVPSLVFSAVALICASLPAKRRATARHMDTEQNPDVILMDQPGALQGSFAPVQRIAPVILWLALPAVAVYIIVSTEQYLLAGPSKIPSIEGMSSVGQWGVWAATGAVLLATTVNAIREKMGLHKGETAHFGSTESENVTYIK
jgi:hypothetical protein